jgi:hypothetical protein
MHMQLNLESVTGISERYSRTSRLYREYMNNMHLPLKRIWINIRIMFEMHSTSCIQCKILKITQILDMVLFLSGNSACSCYILTKTYNLPTLIYTQPSSLYFQSGSTLQKVVCLYTTNHCFWCYCIVSNYSKTLYYCWTYWIYDGFKTLS